MGSHLKLQQKCLKESLSVISNDPPYNLDKINNVENFDVFQSQPFLILTIPKCFPVGEMRKPLL